MFDKMQIILDYPKSIGFSKNEYRISDLDGNILGRWIYQQSKVPYYLENDQGIKVGEIRMETRLGFGTGNLLIFDSSNEFRGSIEGGGRTEGFTGNITLGPYCLKNSLGKVIARTDPFKYRGGGFSACFKGVMKSGLIIRDQTGNVVSNVNGIQNSNVLQINFTSTTDNHFPILCLIISYIS
jgi:hypothetical protein